jgi:hypothetical protein
MTVLSGEHPLAVNGTLKNFTFTYATPYESLKGTPLAVPNVASIPATPIDTYTVLSADFPTISPAPISTKYTAMLTISGKNTDTTNKTINFQINKNGTSVLATSFLSTAGQYFTQDIYKFLDIAAGDVIDIYVWCTASTLITYEYTGFHIMPTRVQLSRGELFKDVSITIAQPITPTQGTPAQGGAGNWYITQYKQGTTDITSQLGAVATFPFKYAYLAGPVAGVNIYSGFGRIYYGDLTQSNNLYQSTTNRPQYFRNFLPTQISFREIR